MANNERFRKTASESVKEKCALCRKKRQCSLYTMKQAAKGVDKNVKK